MDPSRRSTDAPSSSGTRAALALLAALAVLAGCGGWDVARTAARVASATSPVAPAAPFAGPTTGRAVALTASDRPAPLRSLDVRGVPLAGAPAPFHPSDVDGPGRSAADAPRGPSSALSGESPGHQTGWTAGGPSARGPPATAGTDVTLPPRP